MAGPELLENLLIRGTQGRSFTGRFVRILQKTYKHRHLDGRHGGAVVAFQRALKLPQHNPLNFAHAPAGLALVDKNWRGHRFLD
jgi:hypothetical protein